MNTSHADFVEFNLFKLLSIIISDTTRKYKQIQQEKNHENKYIKKSLRYIDCYRSGFLFSVLFFFFGIFWCFLISYFDLGKFLKIHQNAVRKNQRTNLCNCGMLCLGILCRFKEGRRRCTKAIERKQHTTPNQLVKRIWTKKFRHSKSACNDS